jgi:hypothetical protein
VESLSSVSKSARRVRSLVRAWPAGFVSLLVAAALSLHPSAGAPLRVVGAIAALLSGVLLALGVASWLFRQAVARVEADPGAAARWMETRGMGTRFLLDDDGQIVAITYEGWEDVARAHLAATTPDALTPPPHAPRELVSWLAMHSGALHQLRLLWAETVGSMLGAQKCTTCGSIADRGCNGEPSCATCACRRCGDREPIARLPWVEQAMLLAQAMNAADYASKRVDSFLESLSAGTEAPSGTHEHSGGAHGAN